VALDRARPDAVRLAALRVLGELEPKTIAPLLASLAADASAAIRAEAAPAKKGRRAAADPLALVVNAAAQGLHDEAVDGAAVRRALYDAADSVPLPVLQQLIEHLRERESAEPILQRSEWTAARAAAHLALASRGSRLALYDLRESLQAAGPLPIEFITAVAAIGDASCLQPIAAGYAKTKQAAWRNELAGAFRAIVGREKLTRRHAAVKKIAARAPQTLEALWPHARGTGG
jgi:hypothetical protein